MALFIKKQTDRLTTYRGSFSGRSLQDGDEDALSQSSLAWPSQAALKQSLLQQPLGRFGLL